MFEELAFRLGKKNAGLAKGIVRGSVRLSEEERMCEFLVIAFPRMTSADPF